MSFINGLWSVPTLSPGSKDLQQCLEGSVFGLEPLRHVVIKGVISPHTPRIPTGTLPSQWSFFNGQWSAALSLHDTAAP